MREFFRGWRRKMGCVTMVIACGIVGLWGRGQSDARSRDFRLPISDKIAYGVMLMPRQIQVLRYLTVRYGNQRATGAESLLKIPYWSVITPLTVFSALLLLSKPPINLQKSDRPNDAPKLPHA